MIADIAIFQANRSQVPLEELLKYNGQWVAFSADGRRIVAGGNDLSEVADRLAATGIDFQEVAFEHIVMDPGLIEIGWAEFS